MSIIKELRADEDDAISDAAKAASHSLVDGGEARAAALCRLIGRLHDADRDYEARQVISEAYANVAYHWAQGATKETKCAVARVAHDADACYRSLVSGPRPVDVIDGAA
jgi:hypothetical protein